MKRHKTCRSYVCAWQDPRNLLLQWLVTSISLGVGGISIVAIRVHRYGWVLFLGYFSLVECCSWLFWLPMSLILIRILFSVILSNQFSLYMFSGKLWNWSFLVWLPLTSDHQYLRTREFSQGLTWHKYRLRITQTTHLFYCRAWKFHISYNFASLSVLVYLSVSVFLCYYY